MAAADGGGARTGADDPSLREHYAGWDGFDEAAALREADEQAAREEAAAARRRAEKALRRAEDSALSALRDVSGVLSSQAGVAQLSRRPRGRGRRGGAGGAPRLAPADAAAKAARLREASHVAEAALGALQRVVEGSRALRAAGLHTPVTVRTVKETPPPDPTAPRPRDDPVAGAADPTWLSEARPRAEEWSEAMADAVTAHAPAMATGACQILSALGHVAEWKRPTRASQRRRVLMEQRVRAQGMGMPLPDAHERDAESRERRELSLTPEAPPPMIAPMTAALRELGLEPGPPLPVLRAVAPDALADSAAEGIAAVAWDALLLGLWALAQLAQRDGALVKATQLLQFALLVDSGLVAGWVARGAAFARMGALLLAELHADRAVEMAGGRAEHVPVTCPALEAAVPPVARSLLVGESPGGPAGLRVPAVGLRVDLGDAITTPAAFKSAVVASLDASAGADDDSWLAWQLQQPLVSPAELMAEGRALYAEGFARTAGLKYRAAVALLAIQGADAGGLVAARALLNAAACSLHVAVGPRGAASGVAAALASLTLLTHGPTGSQWWRGVGLPAWASPRRGVDTADEAEAEVRGWLRAGAAGAPALFAALEASCVGPAEALALALKAIYRLASGMSMQAAHVDAADALRCALELASLVGRRAEAAVAAGADGVAAPRGIATAVCVLRAALRRERWHCRELAMDSDSAVPRSRS